MADDASSTPVRVPHPEPIEHPAVTLARLRQKAEQAIDVLLQFVDDLGPDPEEEPSLGAPNLAGRFESQVHWAVGADDEREAEDDEHNLGWESPGAQLHLDAGSNDLEPALGRTEALDQRPQRGSLHEDEPTMGSSDGRDQRRWAAGYDPQDSEREDVSEDEGAACEGEGDHDEREQEQGEWCNWADDLEDQRDLKQVPMFSMEVPSQRPFRAHANVGPPIPVQLGPRGGPLLQISGPPLPVWDPMSRTWRVQQ